MSRDIMIDIEALGEPILSIGAVAFDIDTGEISGEFYRTLDLQAQIDLGLKVNADTFFWWLEQNETARRAVQPGPASWTDPGHAIESLRAFVFGEKATLYGAGMTPSADATGPKADRVWAYPTSFDLSAIARLCGRMRPLGRPLRVPWVWTDTMDARTLWKLALAIDPEAAKIEKKETAAKHHALEDAREQAGWVAKYWGIVRGARTG